MHNNKKIILVLLIGVLTILSFLSSSPSRVSASNVSLLKTYGKQAAYYPRINTNINEYLTIKKNNLKFRSNLEPDKIVSSTISFSKWVSINEVNEIIINSNIQVRSIQYAFRGDSLGNGEMRVDSEDNLIEIWNHLLQLHLNSFKSEILREEGLTNAPRSIELLNKYKIQASKKVSQLESSIPIIYAVRVTGTISELNSMINNNNIRIIDIVDQDAANLLNSLSIPETNVYIKGIIPDDTLEITGISKEIN